MGTDSIADDMEREQKGKAKVEKKRKDYAGRDNPASMIKGRSAQALPTEFSQRRKQSLHGQKTPPRGRENHTAT